MLLTEGMFVGGEKYAGGTNNRDSDKMDLNAVATEMLKQMWGGEQGDEPHQEETPTDPNGDDDDDTNPDQQNPILAAAAAALKGKGKGKGGKRGPECWTRGKMGHKSDTCYQNTPSGTLANSVMIPMPRISHT